ncbi:MAG: hypothetical protein AABZ30_10130 [Myxococcota bacterium]
MKRRGPLIVTFLCGAFFAAEYFIPHGRVKATGEVLRDWVAILSAVAFILGGINLLTVNLPKIRRREPDWGYKVVMLAAAAVMLFAGIPWTEGFGKEGRLFTLLYDHVFATCNSMMFALLAFFIASAAFRAFRARNVEAFLMLATAMLVMVAQVPIGDWIAPGFFPEFKRWLLSYGNSAGRRAIMIGAALGAISTGLRVIVGLERSYLGGD